MALSLTGLLVIQFLWVRNTIRLKEAAFDATVLNTLGQVVEKTSMLQRADYIFNLQASDTVDSFTTEIKFKYSNDANKVKVKQHVIKKPIQEQNVEWVHTNTEGKKVKRLHVVTTDVENDTHGYVHTDVAADGQKEVIILSDADTEVIHVEEIYEKVEEQTKAFEHTFRQLAFEYIIDTINSERLINKEELEAVLKNELAGAHVTSPYQWKIIKEASIETMPALSKNKGTKQYRVDLFPDKLYASPTMLEVTFESGFIITLRYLGGIHITSLLFSFIIILSFIYTYRLLLKQKKITEMKSDFINNMTHEFKTPISTINLAIDAINNPQTIRSEEKIKHFTSIIKEENSRMNQQVEKVLHMSTIEKHELHLRAVEVSLNELVLDVVDNFKLIMQQREGSFNIDLKATDDFLLADKEHLQNVVRNLVDNAIKYSEGQPQVTLRTESDSQNLSLIVKDDGIGISPKDQQLIFERFFRVHTGDVHDVKGFGLGLNYVKEVLAQMEADIRLKSQPGIGTEVTLIFHRNL